MQGGQALCEAGSPCRVRTGPLSFLKGFHLDESFFEPLPEDELALWEGAAGERATRQRMPIRSTVCWPCRRTSKDCSHRKGRALLQFGVELLW